VSLNPTQLRDLRAARARIEEILATLDDSTRVCDCCGLTVHNDSAQYRTAAYLRRAVKELAGVERRQPQQPQSGVR
jgi:hypothetical protein